MMAFKFSVYTRFPVPNVIHSNFCSLIHRYLQLVILQIGIMAKVKKLVLQKKAEKRKAAEAEKMQRQVDETANGSGGKKSQKRKMKLKDVIPCK